MTGQNVSKFDKSELFHAARMLPFTMLLLALAPITGRAEAAELQGTIALVSDDAIMIEVEGALRPVKGDRVVVMRAAEDNDSAKPVAMGRVSVSSSDIVIAIIDPAEEKIEKGYLVRIFTSDTPQVTVAAKPVAPTPDDAPRPVAEARTGWIGVMLHTATDPEIKARQLPHGGLIISGVVPEGPGAQAGLAEGDLLLKIQDAEIRNGQQFAKVMSTLHADDLITVEVLRAGSKLPVEFRLGVKPDPADALANILQLAEAGNQFAQFEVGNAYYTGRTGAEKDFEKSYLWHRRSADQGLAKAQWAVGMMTFAGEGVEQDKKKAFDWYMKSAKQQFNRGEHSVGWAYLNGAGVEKNPIEATLWLRKGAEHGWTESYYLLGAMYLNGNGVAKDDKVALGMFEKAAEKGHAGGQNDLGFMYEHGRGTAKDAKQAFNYYRAAATQGMAQAQYNAALCHQFGRGTEKDIKEADRWYRAAAKQGRHDAEYQLGKMYATMNPAQYEKAYPLFRSGATKRYAPSANYLAFLYENGRGVARDHKQAAKWYRQAADEGSVSAQDSLGRLYAMGNGVSKDYRLAMEWFRKAADNGYANAQNNVGWLYDKGFGVNRNRKAAIEWYFKAAQQGHAGAQNSLGFLAISDGFKDYDNAIRWFRLAAAQGQVDALYNLGSMYSNGWGVPKDRNQAIAWMRKAAEQGSEKARQGLRSLGINS